MKVNLKIGDAVVCNIESVPMNLIRGKIYIVTAIRGHVGTIDINNGDCSRGWYADRLMRIAEEYQELGKILYKE